MSARRVEKSRQPFAERFVYNMKRYLDMVEVYSGSVTRRGLDEKIKVISGAFEQLTRRARYSYDTAARESLHEPDSWIPCTRKLSTSLNFPHLL